MSAAGEAAADGGAVDLSVVIPAFDEEARLGPTVERLSSRESAAGSSIIPRAMSVRVRPGAMELARMFEAP